MKKFKNTLQEPQLIDFILWALPPLGLFLYILSPSSKKWMKVYSAILLFTSILLMLIYAFR